MNTYNEAQELEEKLNAAIAAMTKTIKKNARVKLTRQLSKGLIFADREDKEEEEEEEED